MNKSETYNKLITKNSNKDSPNQKHQNNKDSIYKDTNKDRNSTDKKHIN